MTVGTVVWFDERKGYGFISCQDEGTDLFVHYTGISGDGFKTLHKGQIVNFIKTLTAKSNSKSGEQSYAAIDVKPVIKP